MVVYPVYKSILEKTGISLTAYLILFVLYNDEVDYELYRFPKEGKDEFPGLQNHQIAERIMSDKSTVTRQLRKLKRYVIKREKKYYRVITSVRNYFYNMDFNEKYLKLNIHLFRFFKTPEQCVLISYLWDEYHQQEREINLKEICFALPMSRRHIENKIKDWEQQKLISLNNGMIEFDADLKRIMQSFV